MNTTKVAVAIFERNGRVLACQRKQGSRYEFKWEFPGGKVEEGETIEQCLHRELREELSVEIGPVGRTEKELSHYPDGGTYEVAFCFVKDFVGELKNNVFEQFKWVTPDELRTMDILEGNKDFVLRLRVNGRT
jgi:8-oxo-dGTP diphosphatase